jgi:hypothetical protein
MDGNSESANPRRRRPWWFLAATIVLLLAGIVWLVRTLLPGIPQINADDLAAAAAKFRAAAVRDYDLTIVLSGRKSEEIKTTVRNGRAVSVTRNGLPLKDERTRQPWTVEGLFDTIETDFDNAARPEAAFGSADVRVVLRAEFDEKYGIPRRYLQQVYGRLDDLSWTVTEFTPK